MDNIHETSLDEVEAYLSHLHQGVLGSGRIERIQEPAARLWRSTHSCAAQIRTDATNGLEASDVASHFNLG